MNSVRDAQFAGVLSTLIPFLETVGPVLSPNDLIIRLLWRSRFIKRPSIDMDGTLTIACHMKKEFGMLLE